MGILLAFIKPKIESATDRSTIEKSIELLSKIDSTIGDIKYISGNSRLLKVLIKSGSLTINPLEDTITFLIEDSQYEYSEIGKEIEIFGEHLTVNTSSSNNILNVKLILSYKDELNITYKNNEENYAMQKSPTPYDLLITNKDISNPKTNFTDIDFKLP